MTGGGEVHVEGARGRDWRGRGARGGHDWRGGGRGAHVVGADMTGGGEVHVEDMTGGAGGEVHTWWGRT